MPLALLGVFALALSSPTLPRSQVAAIGKSVHLARSAIYEPRAHVGMGLFGNLFGGGKQEADDSFDVGGALGQPLKENKYFDMISNISAPELVQNFAETAPPEVQQAVRATIMGLFGSLPPSAFETAVVSSGKNVASLLYSMQMTGYMFKNAQYRLSLKQSLDKAKAALPGEMGGAGGANVLPKVSGKVTVDLGGQKVEVDAESYVADLHKEVKALKAALAKAEEVSALSAKEQGSGLLGYLQSLPRDKLQELTSSVTPDVLECMQMLVEAVLGREALTFGAGDAVVESSGVKLRELLVWQLVTGYRLRELEAREELNKLVS